MTISYTLDVTSSSFASFAKLLCRWHGSIWKSVYRELAAWMVVYAFLSILYRVYLDPDQKRHSGLFPMTFMLGFFVTVVVQRWWQMFGFFGWIDNCALYVATYIDGDDERVRKIRRNIIRYVVLVEAMVFRDVSPVVKRRFPDDDAFQIAGFLTEKEAAAMKSIISPHGKYWLPIHWSFNLIKQARKSGNIATDRAAELIQEQIRLFRTNLSKLGAFSWVPVPLAYTQLVFVAIRCYMAISVMGRQYVEHSKNHKEINTPVDIYVPVVTILQFIFNLGWMKVAEALLNPYGDDDDDFECNWFIDRNLQVGLSIVDDAIGKEPPLEKDVFWNYTTPTPLYLNGAKNLPIHHINFTIPEKSIRWCKRRIRERVFGGARPKDLNIVELKKKEVQETKAVRSLSNRFSDGEVHNREVALAVDQSPFSNGGTGQGTDFISGSQQEKMSNTTIKKSESIISIYE